MRRFPGYLFCGAESRSAIAGGAVNSTTGIATLFSMAYDRRFRCRTDRGDLVQSTDKAGVLQFTDRLERGRKVRGSPGPLHTRWEFLIRLNDAGRVEVLLRSWGRTRLNLARSWVEPAA